MGRGKKKGDKKGEDAPKEDSSAGTGDQPGTSEQASSLTVEEEFEGLGLGGGRKKKRGKAAAAGQKNVEEKVPEKPEEAAPKPEEKQEPATKPEEKQKLPIKVEEEEDVGLGLGLSGGKKRIRKKKNVASTAATQVAPSSSDIPVVAPESTHLEQKPPQLAQPVHVAPPQMTSTQYPPVQFTPTQYPPPQLAPTQYPPAPAKAAWGAGRGQCQMRPSVPQTEVAVSAPPGFGRGQVPLPPTARPAQQLVQQPITTPQPIQQQVSASEIQQPIQQQAAISQQKQQRALAKEQSRAFAKELAVCRYNIPTKILGASVRSRPVKVLTNYLPMTFNSKLKIHRYDVSFVPDKPKLFLPKVFKEITKKYFPKEVIAFDQMKNCYTLRPLPNNSKNEDKIELKVEVPDINEKLMKFSVTIKPTGIVDLSTIEKYMRNGETSLCTPTEAIQCIDVILKQGTLESYVKAGRQYFKRPSRPIDLGDGLEMWTGLFQSAIFTDRAFINIDVAHKGFPKEQFLIDALVNDFRVSLDRPIESQKGRGAANFLEYIKGLRVVAKVFGSGGTGDQYRQYLCNAIVAPPNAISFAFKDSNGKERQITVAQYFLTEKRYKIKYPNLNCMWVGPKDKQIYYPMELLKVAYGQARSKQLNEMQLATMVKMAATPPDDRKQKIEDVIREMNYSRSDFFKKFGLEISDQFFPVDAKVLEPPSLEVGIQRTVMPRNGSWQANSLLKPEALLSWGFIAIEADPHRCNFDNMINLIMNTGRQMGMNVAKPTMNHFNVRLYDLRNILFSALEKDIKFLFVIISGRENYQKVKQFAERDVGILTQCVKEQTAANRMNPQTMRNILLKVNSKLMGINQALDGRSMPKCLKGGGVMIVGADVTHPSPDQANIPSIAAVTASIDPKCYLYNIELSIQTPKKEMIVEFEDMMVDHFNVFKKHNGMLPKKIYVFRDGVSEGQFSQVMESELTAIHRAYQRLMGPNAKPEILFLLVQKRHHTRFFSTTNLKYNVEPGTVVDKHIVHARELDFYLVSHQAIKGTARPTRYHAVCNDGGIPHDEVEQLTYYLCHLYSRCMRAVSYPTPTYYAHLACLRARSLTYGETFNNRELETKPKRLRVLDRMLEKSRMFFV